VYIYTVTLCTYTPISVILLHVMIIHTYPHYQTPSEWFLLVKNQEAREGAQLLSIYSTACAQLSTNVEGEVKNRHQQTNPLLHFWLVPQVTTGTVVYDINLKLKDVALPVLQDVFHHESILSFPRIPKEKRCNCNNILYEVFMWKVKQQEDL